MKLRQLGESEQKFMIYIIVIISSFETQMLCVGVAQLAANTTLVV